MVISKDSIISLRMERQHLFQRAELQEYNELFRMMSPVFPVYWSCPGAAPQLSMRVNFDDEAWNHCRRSKRELLKGRFQGGNIAYVDQEDWNLYAALYCKELSVLTPQQSYVLDLLRCEGPLNISQIKESSGMLAKEITPILHSLQQAFLVFEDQLDSSWERGWYVLEQEFPQFAEKKWKKQEALQQVLLRFAAMQGFFDEQMAKAFYRLPAKEIREAVATLEEQSLLLKVQTECGQGWILPEDAKALEKKRTPPPSVIALHRNDFWVKSNEHWLKKQFVYRKPDVLQYLLIDGTIQGAVLGAFKNGPFEIQDVVLHMTPQQCDARKEEVLKAVGAVNDPLLSPVPYFCGEKLT